MRPRLPSFRVVAIALALGAGACASILGLRPRDHNPFEHREHVLNGIHCMRCHRGVVGAEEEGPLHIPQKAECVECHRRPHDTGECGNCHGLFETRQAVVQAREHLRFSHKNHVPRVRGDCVQCHVDIRRGAETVRPRMGACLGCHEHSDDFEVRDCDRCHVDLHVEQTPPESHLVHEGDWRREHGARTAGAREMCGTCHADQFCAGCHGVTTATTPERIRIDDPFTPGVHRGNFMARHSSEARANPGLCTTCHTPDVCSECHREQGRTAGGGARGTPHPAGWLGASASERNDHGPAARRDPLACAACHSGPGEAMCIGCHRVGGIGGNPHPAGWSSNLRPRLDAACRPCHEGTR